MKAAIIDIGSNSLRLLLGEKTNGQWINQPKQLWMTRLGSRSEAGELTDEAIKASLKAMEEIRQAAETFGAERVVALATNAVREAPNGRAFMEQAAQVCPMEFHILTGEEEAELGFAGAVPADANPEQHYLVIDIGGGSTEMSLGTASGGVYWKRSLPAGAVRLKALSDEDPQAIWDELQGFWVQLPLRGPFGGFIGIGGTVTTLAAMDLKLTEYDPAKVQGHLLFRETVEGQLMALRYMSAEERASVPGLQPERADIIVAGGEILTAFMDAYDAGHVICSDRDLLEGYELKLEAKQ